MIKSETIKELKSWPFKEAMQILAQAATILAVININE